MVKETLPGRGIWWVRRETRDEEGVGKGREASATAAAELVAAMPHLLGGGRGRVGAFWLFRLKLGVFFLSVACGRGFGRDARRATRVAGGCPDPRPVSVETVSFYPASRLFVSVPPKGRAEPSEWRRWAFLRPVQPQGSVISLHLISIVSSLPY